MNVETTRIPGQTSGTGVPRPPFGGKRRLVTAAPVVLPGSRQRSTCDVGVLAPDVGTTLVVRTRDGDVLAATVDHFERKVVASEADLRAVRVATEADRTAWDRAVALQDKALRAAVRSARRVQIDAKMVTAFVPLSGDKTIVYYSAEERVDARKLARELSSTLGGRVELRAIGVREGAGAIGGLGPCGGELCCSSFLTRFGSISLRFAKDQGLSLNPGRVTGMCGRLKCCLVYEESTYKEMKGYAPRKKNGVYTPNGAGNILDVDVVNRRVLVRLSGGAMDTFHVRDVTVLDRTLTPEEVDARGPSKEDAVLAARRRRRGGGDAGSGLPKQAPAVLAEDYIWDDTAGSAAISTEIESEAPARKKRRRRRKPRAEGAAAPTDAPSAESRGSSAGQTGPQPSRADSRPPRPPRADQAESSAGQAPGDGEARKKRRRPRRRGGRGKGGGTGEGGPDTSGGQGNTGTE